MNMNKEKLIDWITECKKYGSSYAIITVNPETKEIVRTLNAYNEELLSIQYEVTENRGEEVDAVFDLNAKDLNLQIEYYLHTQEALEETPARTLKRD